MANVALVAVAADVSGSFLFAPVANKGYKEVAVFFSNRFNTGFVVPVEESDRLENGRVVARPDANGTRITRSEYQNLINENFH